MGMSTHVVGFRPADEEWNRMKAAYDSCIAAGVEIPTSVDKFFDHEPPGDRPGMEVNINSAVREWTDKNCRGGYEIELRKLPANVKVIRFYNSW